MSGTESRGPARQEAADALSGLLADAARDLVRLGPACIVAASPNAHDDTGRYPEWHGVQVGRATWERTDYRLDCGGDVNESARNPDDLPAARAVLERLQAASWRSLAASALGYDFYDEVLALAIQYGAAWFVVAGSNWGHDDAFLLDGKGGLVRVGKPARLDDRLGRVSPLVLEKVDPATWSVFQALAPGFPVPRSASPSSDEAKAARVRFTALVKDAFAKMSAVPGHVRLVASARSDIDRPQVFSGPWRAVVLDRASATMTSWSKADERYARDLDAGGPALGHVDDVLSGLVKAGWLDLFDEGFMNLGQEGSLALLVRGSACNMVVSQVAVFELDGRGDLLLVGACDHFRAGFVDEDLVVHRFDDV